MFAQPAKQNAEDTISTLCARLQSATLLEDRRAAVLGLRSFAKLYPASVASGALRNLINAISSADDDIDTTKVVLETLLMLFSPDESSPEASDDISFWLADEFTQRQENITALLNLLERHDFFSRLYALQLVSAISAARPERTQECVFTAPLGVSRLTAILDDAREAIRGEALLLLISLTPTSPDLQKLVAFENAFDRTFKIIEDEGSLNQGGVAVQDCLALLANLLRLNVSNQSFFREAGGVNKVAFLLKQCVTSLDEDAGDAVWAASQRDKNIWGFLSILRLFMLDGSSSTSVNQMSFWQHGVTLLVLALGFHDAVDLQVRTQALITCADLIRGHSTLQESFAQQEVSFRDIAPSVPSTPTPQTNGVQKRLKESVKMNVIQALLDVALGVSGDAPIDIRLAASECIKAYLFRHGPIKSHFLGRAREGHLSTQGEADNIFTILMNDSGQHQAPDQYRRWIAAVVLFHLLFEDYDSKVAAMSISEGDVDRGEEVVTCIQLLSSNLVVNADKVDKDRVSVGYLMVLSAWLYEDFDAVNDFLGEGSNVQGLVHQASSAASQKSLVSGLCAFLLGIAYEFSSKDSPIPRRKLHEILTSQLGRENYISRMTKLREHPFIRDFEVQKRVATGVFPEGIPEHFLDKTFVDFLKDNYNRILRAIDRDPGVEISVVANGVQKGVSRELVDSLRAQLEDRTQALQSSETEMLSLQHKLAQEQADHRKTKEGMAVELTRIRTINENLHRNHEDEVQQLRVQTDRSISDLRSGHGAELRSIQEAMARQKDDAENSAGRVRQRHEAELGDVQQSLQDATKRLEKANRDHEQDLRIAHEDFQTQLKTLESRLRRAEERAGEAEQRAKDAREQLEQERKQATTAAPIHDELKEKNAALQTELDDLLIVMADLEEKRAKDKGRLKVLGESVSGDEDDEDEDEDGENGDDVD